MQGTSKLVMGATLIMAVSLAIVLGLVLVFLAELYCSLLLRKRRFRITTSNAASAHSPQQQDLLVPPPSILYAHGVLQAPRSFLFPAIIAKEEENEKVLQQNSEPHHVHESQTQEPTGLSSASFPSPSYISVPSPRPIQEATLQGSGDEHLVYISNPIYDNNSPSRAGTGTGTPFETPDTSPSRLEMDGSSGDDENAQVSQSSPSSLPITPPLSPMKKLPAEACSVSLRDARCLGTSGSDSNSNNALSSSSSSGSPCTSPSW